jgi:hypothetical protein
VAKDLEDTRFRLRNILCDESSGDLSFELSWELIWPGDATESQECSDVRRFEVDPQ